MPVWHQIFNELRLTPKVVLCLRNPAQVARSLQARDGLDPANGEYRWLVHMIDFYRYTSNFDCCTLEYEEWFNNPSGNIEKLKQFLGLQWQQSESDLGLVLSGIIDPAVRHDDPTHREPGQPLVRALYELARSTVQDGVRDQITSIVSQFISYQQLQRPFVKAFEDIAKTAAKFPDFEQELACLRAAAGESHALVEAQRAELEELAKERAACVLIENEASSLKATLAEREAALAGLSRRADELASKLVRWRRWRRKSERCVGA